MKSETQLNEARDGRTLCLESNCAALLRRPVRPEPVVFRHPVSHSIQQSWRDRSFARVSSLVGREYMMVGSENELDTQRVSARRAQAQHACEV